MKNTVLRALAIVSVLSPAVAFTQSGKTTPTKATYITKEEVDTVNSKGQGIDRNIKVVDIGHENFTVGIIHRGKTVNGVAVPTGAPAANAAAGAGRAGGAAAPAPTPCGRQMPTAPAGGTAGGITHDSQTEGYYIVSGGGTMFTDGYIVNGRHNLSPDLNGPTCGGMAYEVIKKVVKPGDIVIVPAGVVHGWLDIGEHVDYLSFRPSPNILTAGWVHPVLKGQ
jgi:mannose-6-phosphate isomerase-like protein (cupin superfamily)